MLLTDDYVLLPVKRAWLKPEKGKGFYRVYNLEVHTDNSYVAEGVVVHNCMICHKKAGMIGVPRCDETNCIDEDGNQYKGCKTAMIPPTVYANGKIQCVDNVEPEFFDMSIVDAPAYPSAYGFVVDYMGDKKTASFTFPGNGYLNLELEGKRLPSFENLMKSQISKLASVENTYGSGKSPEVLLGYGFCVGNKDIELGKHISNFSTEEKYACYRVLAEQGVLLSPEAFCESIGVDKSAGYDIRYSSPGIFANMLVKYAGTNFKLPANVLAALEYSRISRVPESVKYGSVYLYSSDDLIKKVKEGSLIAYNSYGDANPQLAEAYALYKAAALIKFPESKKQFGIKQAVLNSWKFN
jgi:hypothetical protein